ncbi:MAG: Sporulation integral rane protein YlbJ, partial [Clostridia bacterium]|nr:Sporulation integral rane protein YlbJ [Clostridia bacterium]
LGIVSFVGSCFKAIMKPLFNVPGEASFTFFMSIASGYPVGAKITATLLQNKVCSKVEAQRMLSLCSTSGPLFIIGAVATGILKNPKLGLLLALSHYLSALTAGLLMRFYGRSRKTKEIIQINELKRKFNPLSDMLEYRKKDGRSLGILMGDAVKNGISLVLLVGGFIILFSVITRILKLSGVLAFLSKLVCASLYFLHLNPDSVSSVIVGMLEVTNGINHCAAVEMPVISKLMMVSFMIGFGGLSINAQVLSVIAGSNLRFGLYMLVKLFQGAAAAVFTYLLFGITGATQVFNVYDSLNVSYYVRYLNSGMLSRLWDSSLNLLVVLAAMLIFILTVYKKRAKAQP